MAKYSKTLLLVGLAFAVVLLISSEISSARELAETTQSQVGEANYGDHHGFDHGHGHNHGHGHGHGGHGHHGGKPGHGGRRGHGAAETQAGEN